MTTRRALLGGAAAALGLGLTGCRAAGSSSSPVPTPGPGSASASALAADPVAVRVVLPGPLTLGVVVSLASSDGEGAQWAAGAEGAHVAMHRLARGGAQLNLLASNDKGTVEGFGRAVAELVAQGASGIVVASSGSHVQAALRAATAHHVPLVLCHPMPAAVLGAGVWSVAPTTEQVTGQLVRQALPRTVLVDAGGGSLAGLAPVRRLPAAPQGLSAGQLKALAPVVADGHTDVVVTGGPEAMAAVAAGLQGIGFPGRVLLGPDALSPRFARALGAAGASLSQGLVCSGVATDDPSALTEGDDGRAVSQFLAAVRDAADSQLTSFFDGLPLREVLWAADAASHDAVVALACAAGLAVSTDPGAVAARMGRMTLGHHDGLVGPALDLTRSATGARPAVPDARVVTLTATADDPGLRPAPPATTHQGTQQGATQPDSTQQGTAQQPTSAAGGSSRLFWFADN